MNGEDSTGRRELFTRFFAARGCGDAEALIISESRRKVVLLARK
jgi:hypothetical protein